VADARAVLADPAAAGLPYVFAVNDKSGFVQADVDYVRGFASVLGDRAAAYGFSSFLRTVRAQCPVSLYWQAGLPPSATGTQGWVHFWQRQGSPGNGTDGPATPVNITLDGVSCDLDNQLLEVPVTSPTPWNGLWPADAPEAVYALKVKEGVLNGNVVAVTVQPDQQGVWLANTCLRLEYVARQMLPDLAAQFAALTGALSADEAALLAAIQSGGMDVNAFAAKLAPVLAPLLPADATPAAVGEAVVAALEAHLAK
jgi:hypothetical protein